MIHNGASPKTVFMWVKACFLLACFSILPIMRLQPWNIGHLSCMRSLGICLIHVIHIFDISYPSQLVSEVGRDLCFCIIYIYLVKTSFVLFCFFSKIIALKIRRQGNMLEMKLFIIYFLSGALDYCILLRLWNLSTYLQITCLL